MNGTDNLGDRRIVMLTWVLKLGYEDQEWIHTYSSVWGQTYGFMNKIMSLEFH